MGNFLDTVRAYFYEKNRVWLTGDLEPLRRAAHAAAGKSWWKQTGNAVDRKRQSATWRRGELLRSHTRVNVRHITQHDPQASMEAIIDETVTWVYRDGFEYGVEARVIRHFQRWHAEGGLWRLEKELESDELQRIPTELAASAATPRYQAPLVGLRTVERSISQQTQTYDRLRAFRYAELWWNSWNPSFVKLEDDCTNFISQCLWAGNLPMKSMHSRASGWWYRFSNQSKENWSYSWSTSQALYNYLTGQVGAVRVSSAQELKVGDVVFYDWSGQGTFHHSTMVVDFDKRGDPLVNAHTDASWHRHYLYLDSRAWTARTRYAFVRMPDSVG